MKTVKLKSSGGHSIGVEEAKRWIGNFQKKHPEKPESFFFGEDLIVRIIGHNDAVGFKIYQACSDDNALQLIMVGTREDGSEIWPASEGKQGTNAHIGIGVPCVSN